MSDAPDDRPAKRRCLANRNEDVGNAEDGRRELASRMDDSGVMRDGALYGDEGLRTGSEGSRASAGETVLRDTAIEFNGPEIPVPEGRSGGKGQRGSLEMRRTLASPHLSEQH